jgi:nicotinate-nucleotide adenylyltransferase
LIDKSKLHVGILGGTFDPPHYGHLYNAINCMDQLNLDYVFLNPSYQPPHKDREITDDKHRYKMTKKLANCDQSKEKIKARFTDINHEFTRTYETLNYYSNDHWGVYFLIGSDMLQTFHEWKQYKDLLNNYNIVVVPRPGYKVDGEDFVLDHIHSIIKTSSEDISSTEIRQNPSKYVDKMPESVYSYIVENDLYGQ